MTIAVQDQDKEAVFAHHVTIAREQHKRLLRKFTTVSDHVIDLVALMWLPGRHQTFENSVRSVMERDRPVLLTLEVNTYGDLRFSGAISRFRGGELIFKPVFSYDAGLPLTYTSAGPALSAKNLSLARRLNDLLAALVDLGRAIFRRGHTAPVAGPRWPAVICDKYGKVFEDYAPTLGMTIANPARRVSSIPVPVSAGQTVNMPLHDATKNYSAAVIEFLRQYVPTAVSRDVSDADLLRAAQNPQADLAVSRRSKIQICPVSTVQDLPVGYAGTVLAPVDWAPPARDIFGE